MAEASDSDGCAESPRSNTPTAFTNATETDKADLRDTAVVMYCVLVGSGVMFVLDTRVDVVGEKRSRLCVKHAVKWLLPRVKDEYKGAGTGPRKRKLFTPSQVVAALLHLLRAMEDDGDRGGLTVSEPGQFQSFHCKKVTLKTSMACISNVKQPEHGPSFYRRKRNSSQLTQYRQEGMAWNTWALDYPMAADETRRIDNRGSKWYVVDAINEADTFITALKTMWWWKGVDPSETELKGNPSLVGWYVHAKPEDSPSSKNRRTASPSKPGSAFHITTGGSSSSKRMRRHSTDGHSSPLALSATMHGDARDQVPLRAAEFITSPQNEALVDALLARKLSSAETTRLRLLLKVLPS